MKDVFQFIKEYIEYIDNNDWKTVYSALVDRCPDDATPIGQFTATMLNAGVNPLQGLKSIPAGFAFDLGTDASNKISISADIRAIKEFAFCGADITDLDLSHTKIMFIDTRAFSRSSLSSIKFPKNMKAKLSIASLAFSECENLRKIELPNNINNIAFNCFFNTPLEKVIFDSTREQLYNDVAIAESAFNGTKVTEIECTDGLISLKDLFGD